MKFPEGIAAQPAALATSLASLKLPSYEGGLIALVGIGASEYAAQGAATAWRSTGLPAVAIPASAPPLDAAVTLLISESGRSAEVLAYKPSSRTIALTNFPDSPLAATADELILLNSGPDSPVYTTGYTATLQALGALGDRWTAAASAGVTAPASSAAASNAAGSFGSGFDWTSLPALVSAALVAPLGAASAYLDEARVVDVVASGVSVATAGEGGLLLRESGRLHTAAHETRNYLHGPMEILDQQTTCVLIGDGREVQLAYDVLEYGAKVVLITTADVEPADDLAVIKLPWASNGLARAVVEMVVVQRLGWEVAQRRGLKVDGFRHRQSDTKVS
ncbi:SIS domain-containing protein [Kribbella koreensis]|uniref:Glutamine--fructose-6-phosphate aminotransferase [isomerizing] n=1 Tax=Kribbella koreensis TaxID=57909 RepID=A0ABN1PS71_9ACTN